MVFPDVIKLTVVLEDGQENILLSLSNYRDICLSYENLRNEVAARYPKLLQYEDFKFYWIDDEQDEITIVNHVDYSYYMDMGGQKRRLYVRGVNKIESIEDRPVEEYTAVPTESSASTSTVPQEDLPVHTGVVCDVCDETIRGHRYKCMQCFNYDLCMCCEGKYRHKEHIMVRIPLPELNRRAPFRLFDKLRSYASEMGTQSGAATATDNREDDYNNSKRSKRHHRRHSKDREEAKESREEKERKERKQRRERSTKSAEDRRSSRRCPGSTHHFNFSHLLNQVIDPANIHSAFLSSDVAASAAAAAAESAQEALRTTMFKCPVFSTMSTSAATNCATTSASASTSNGTSTTQATTTATTATTVAPEIPAEKKQEACVPLNSQEEPQPSNTTTESGTSTNSNKNDILNFSWLAPTAESLQKINETFSKILDPLGMNIEIRSNDSTPKPAQTQTPTEEKHDKTTETANTPTTSTPSQTVDTRKNVGDLMSELQKQFQASSVTDTQKTNAKAAEYADNSISDDDYSSVSSVSLLSENDDPANKTEKQWTLVDIPNDEDQLMSQSPEREATKEITVGQNSVQTTSNQSPKAPATPMSIPEPSSVSSAKNTTVKQIDYEQLGKALKEHLDAERQASQSSMNAPKTQAIPLPWRASVADSQAAPLTTPAAPVTTPAAPITTPAAPVSPAVSATPAAQFTEPDFGSDSRVNYAVYKMMTMGFSNEGGWLRRLLESVNGDIPRALDLMTPHNFNS